ncbi:Bifunctional inhibitor/plant lipid transfer protein/seed storage helical domain [Dillenia turbinata]|uniref:Bifunctional inhibitor/plant lipid transfer protein/seed storage helical domain n=1 Tax=Dillenia turbinata TaxID=194707 RepID=A0AAN8ZU89_9MAGN
MATSNTSTLALMVVVGMVVIFAGSYQVSAQCGGDPSTIFAKCQSFVLIPGPKIPPSADCCASIKNVDIPCICKLITPPIEKIISMEKVVYVGRTCGLNIPPGLKCGSYTVPPQA